MSNEIWKLRADILRGVTGVKYQYSQEKSASHAKRVLLEIQMVRKTREYMASLEN